MIYVIAVVVFLIVVCAYLAYKDWRFMTSDSYVPDTKTLPPKFGKFKRVCVCLDCGQASESIVDMYFYVCSACGSQDAEIKIGRWEYNPITFDAVKFHVKKEELKI